MPPDICATKESGLLAHQGPPFIFRTLPRWPSLQQGQTEAELQSWLLQASQARELQQASQAATTTRQKRKSGRESWQNSSTCAQELCSYVCFVSLSPSTCNEAGVVNKETYIYTYIWIQMGMGGDGV